MRDASKSRCPTLYFLLPIVDPARVLMDNSLFGSRVIMSEISQFNASQSRSKCSRLIRVAISWYRSLIVPALIPVILDISMMGTRIGWTFRRRWTTSPQIMIYQICRFSMWICASMWCGRFGFASRSGKVPSMRLTRASSRLSCTQTPQ